MVLERASSTEITVEPVATIDAARALAPAWSALADACPWATTFQRPEWVLPFLGASGAEPRLLCVRGEGALLGIVPLATGPEPRMWTLAGTGPSDVLDLLAMPRHADAVAHAAMAHLATRDDWDVVELHELRESSALRRIALRSRLVRAAVDAPHSVSPVLSVPARARALEDVVPASMAQRARKDVRRALRDGLAIEVSTRETRPETIDEVLDAWITTHAARWEARGARGVIDRAEAFHRGAARAVLESGLGEIVSLRGAGTIRASYLVLLDRTRIAFYLGGFDPSLAARSPLVVLIASTIERHLARGALCEIDFLRGAEAYKHRWGAVDRTQHRVRLERVVA